MVKSISNDDECGKIPVVFIMLQPWVAGVREEIRISQCFLDEAEIPVQI